jgi:hypothetical protein
VFRITLLSLLTAIQSLACQCVAFETPKAEWQRSALVFVGRVEKVREFSRRNPTSRQQATVRVEEAFKGVEKGQRIEIDRESGDCGLRYEKGWRRLLYLSHQKDGLWLGPACDRSTDMESALDDLKFLCALPASASRTRISGEVFVSGDPRRPLPRVSVTIVKIGSPPTTVVTDAKGVFEVYDLPKGTYTVSVNIPSGFRQNFGFVSGPRTFSDTSLLTVDLGDSHATAVFYLLTSTNSK